jgi:CRP/FNR family transcriptional regulator, anaerobic regulatory protein
MDRAIIGYIGCGIKLSLSDDPYLITGSLICYVCTMSDAILSALERLRHNLMLRAQVTDHELMAVASKLTYHELAKNELLTQAGQVESYVYFVVEGVARTFFFHGEREVSVEFFFPGDFTSSYVSFLKQLPSELTIEAFTPMQVLRIHRDELYHVFTVHPKLEQLNRLILEELFEKSSERVKSLISLSATERYLELLNAHPVYVRNIPLKYLASYLNVTPESLSRIRKAL